MSGGLGRRGFFAAAMMLGGAGLAAAMRPTRHMADQFGVPNIEELFPRQFGDWRVDTSVPVILPSPDTQALLDKIYNQVLARTYVDSAGARVMLSIAYGGDQSDGTSAHRPEVCYPAQGFAISSNRIGSLRVGEIDIGVRLLMSHLGNRHEPITYWVVVGGETVTSGIGQKLAQMRYGLRGVIADGMLVRLSSIETDAESGYRVHARFVASAFAAMSTPARARFFGGAAAG